MSDKERIKALDKRHRKIKKKSKAVIEKWSKSKRKKSFMISDGRLAGRVGMSEFKELAPADRKIVDEYIKHLYQCFADGIVKMWAEKEPVNTP